MTTNTEAQLKLIVGEPVACRWKYRFKDIGETGAYEYHSRDYAVVAYIPKGESLYTADQLAAAVAAERERAATVVDEKIGSVCKANPGRGGRINAAVAFALDALEDCAVAIRAGAKGEPS